MNSKRSFWWNRRANVLGSEPPLVLPENRLREYASVRRPGASTASIVLAAARWRHAGA